MTWSRQRAQDDLEEASDDDLASPTYQSAPLLGDASEQQLIHLVWDLWMWSAVGGTKEASGLGIREALAGKPFSPVWRTYHLALVDLQKQLGWPIFFITISPCEWSFPYHVYLEDELAKTLKARLCCPAAETEHIAHVLTQAVKGLLTGATDGFHQQSKHVFAKEGEANAVLHWVA